MILTNLANSVGAGMKNLELKINGVYEDRGLSRGLAQVEAELNKTNAKSISSLKSLALGYATTGLSIAGLTLAMKQGLAIAMESELIESRLENALKQRKMLTDENTASLNALADAIQAKTTLDDDAIKSQETYLIQIGMTTKEIEKTIKASVDLSSAMNMDLDSAVKLMGKAFLGNTAMMGRYGIQLDETLDKTEKFNQAVSKISTMFAGSAEADRSTLSGSLTALGNSFENLVENVFVPATGKLASIINKITFLTDALGNAPATFEQGKKSNFIKSNYMGTYATNALYGESSLSRRTEELKNDALKNYKFIVDMGNNLYKVFDDIDKKWKTISTDINGIYKNENGIYTNNETQDSGVKKKNNKGKDIWINSNEELQNAIMEQSGKWIGENTIKQIDVIAEDMRSQWGQATNDAISTGLLSAVQAGGSVDQLSGAINSSLSKAIDDALNKAFVQEMITKKYIEPMTTQLSKMTFDETGRISGFEPVVESMRKMKTELPLVSEVYKVFKGEINNVKNALGLLDNTQKTAVNNVQSGFQKTNDVIKQTAETVKTASNEISKLPAQIEAVNNSLNTTAQKLNSVGLSSSGVSSIKGSDLSSRKFSIQAGNGFIGYYDKNGQYHSGGYRAEEFY